MHFVKMQGLGNDFIVINGPSDPTPEQISQWCDRRHGIGADGVLEVTAIDNTRVRMRYWNADGGAAEMCGNGLRCVAKYAADRNLVESNSFVVDTAVGPRRVEVNKDGSVRAFLGTPTSGEAMTVEGVDLHTVDIGNPHAIHWVEDTQTAHLKTLGPRVECADAFPAGTNVEFASIVGSDEIELRVWERGVGETLACGTGAAATAFLAHEQGRVGAAVTLRLLGGTLQVELDADGAWIQGPAETVFSGVVY